MHAPPFQMYIRERWTFIYGVKREREEQKEGSHNGHGIVVEYGGNVFRGELVRGIADEQTCLSDCTVADDDAPAERGELVWRAWKA